MTLAWLTSKQAKAWLLAAAFFLLPWQTRYIFGWLTIGGDISSFGSLSVYATELLVALVGVGTVVMPGWRPRLRPEYRWPIGLAMLIFLAALLSTLWSDSPLLTLQAAGHIGLAMLLFVLLLDAALDLRPVLWGFGLGLVIPTVVGIWQVVFDASPASTPLGLAVRNAEHLGDVVTVDAMGNRQLRAYGSFPHPNIFGGFLAVGTLTVRALLGKVASGERREASRAPAALLMLFLVIGLVLTASRSAILGLVLGIGLAAFVAHYRNTARARILVVPIAIVVIAVAIASTIVTPDLITKLRGGDTIEYRSLSERVTQYQQYPTVVAENPHWWAGAGIGTYPFMVSRAYPGESVWDYQPIHNVPLLIFAELGILGLVVLVWSSTIDRLNFRRFPNNDALTAFAMGNVILVILFFDHYLWTQWSGLGLVAYVMALTVRMGEE